MDGAIEAETQLKKQLEDSTTENDFLQSELSKEVREKRTLQDSFAAQVGQYEIYHVILLIPFPGCST